MPKKNKKISVALCIILAVLVAAVAVVYAVLGPSSNGTGKKNISVDIVTDTGTETVKIKTNAETLRAALEEKSLIKGDESDYGLFITSVNGIEADSSKEQWWCITKNGETVNAGVDTVYIADGEKYELTLKTGYDEY